MILEFPPHFSFGSATAAFQVEGNTGERKSDWDNFLRDHPEIVKPDEKGPQWWLKDKAENDITEMHKLGLTVQRISLEWARIEPEKGKIKHSAITRYKEIISHIIKLGMAPMVTINHYALPEWIAEKGSWETDKIIAPFLQFVELAVSTFPEVPYWITLNEPNFLLDAGYLSGVYPPEKKDFFVGLSARSQMISAHQQAFKVIKKRNSSAQIGVAFALRWYPPENKYDPFELLYTKIINYLDNYNFITAMKDADFIGCNFYTGYFLNLDITNLSRQRRMHGIHQSKLFGEMKPPDAYVTDFDWPIVPDFFLALLRDLYKSFNKPIIITENGLADHQDKYRSFYILTHLVALWQAIHEGVPVKQYIHWATIDNIEWLEGYRMHFGLVALDPVTGKRTLRHSAQLYKEIATTKSIDIEKLITTYLEKGQQEKARKVIHSLLKGELNTKVLKS